MMAVVGLALAVTAIALGTVPNLGAMALVPASIGFVFSVIGLVQSRRTHYGKWLAIPGVVLSIAAACWVPVAATVIPKAVRSVSDISLGAAPARADVATASAQGAQEPVRTLAPPPPRGQYSPPAMRRHSGAPATPAASAAAAPDMALRRELEASVAELAGAAKGALRETWAEEVAALRGKIKEVSDEQARAQLHRALDDSVMALVEADAASSLERAQFAYDKGLLAEADEALAASAKRREACGGTVSYVTPATRSVVSAADFQRRLAMLSDPSKRYVPRGVLGGSRGVRVTLHDGLTGENRVVEEGSTLDDGSEVAAINEGMQQVELRRDGASYVLRW